MTLPNLLTELCRLGIQIVINGEQSRLRAPRGVIMAELRDSVAEHKQDLIAILGEGQHPDPLLPDRVFYPASLESSDEAFRHCYETQRLPRAA